MEFDGGGEREFRLPPKVAPVELASVKQVGEFFEEDFHDGEWLKLLSAKPGSGPFPHSVRPSCHLPEPGFHPRAEFNTATWTNTV
jgi:hypothetical protein